MDFNVLPLFEAMRDKMVPYNYFKASLDASIKKGYISQGGQKSSGIRVYCDFCKWAQSGPLIKFCAYGHGEMLPIQKYPGLK